MSLTPSPVVVDALNADALVVSAVPGGVPAGRPCQLGGCDDSPCSAARK